MGTKFTAQTLSGYNSSAPVNDGTKSDANRVDWTTIKSKLSDPLNQYISDIQTALLVHISESLADIGIAYTTTASDHKKSINVTAGVIISLGDATTMAAGYVVTIKNSHTAAITVSRATGGDTIDGTAADLVLQPAHSVTFVTNASLNGYHVISYFNTGYFTENVTMAGTCSVLGDVDIAGSLDVEAYSEDVDATADGGAITLDTSLATYFYTPTLASIPTFTFSNPVASGRLTSFTLEMNNAANFAPVWPTSVDWSEGTEPSWSTGRDFVTFITRDGGTVWNGFLGGVAMA